MGIGGELLTQRFLVKGHSTFVGPQAGRGEINSSHRPLRKTHHRMLAQSQDERLWGALQEWADPEEPLAAWRSCALSRS